MQLKLKKEVIKFYNVSILIRNLQNLVFTRAVDQPDPTHQKLVKKIFHRSYLMADSLATLRKLLVIR